MPDPATTTPVPPQLTAAEKRRALEQTIAALAALFPATFAAEPWQPHKPLKLGTHLDLIARGVLLAHHVVAFRGHRFVIHRHRRRRGEAATPAARRARDRASQARAGAGYARHGPAMDGRKEDMRAKFPGCGD